MDKTDPTGKIAGVDDVAEVEVGIIVVRAVIVAGAAIAATPVVEKIADNIGDAITHVMANEHTKGARQSTKDDHEKGTSRKARDRGGEKGDDRRDPPRKRPDDWKGPWPPKRDPAPKPDPKPDPPPKPDPVPKPNPLPKS